MPSTSLIGKASEQISSPERTSSYNNMATGRRVNRDGRDQIKSEARALISTKNFWQAPVRSFASLRAVAGAVHVVSVDDGLPATQHNRRQARRPVGPLGRVPLLALVQTARLLQGVCPCHRHPLLPLKAPPLRRHCCHPRSALCSSLSQSRQDHLPL
jgi:hypothetical protein